MVQLRFWRRRGITDQAISPDAPFCVIGDVHGCADLLDRLITRLDTSFPTDPIVVAGDFIDRGPNSAKVLKTLSAHPRVQCLLGNHEDMLLNFLSGQTDDVRAWLRAGGSETLSSLGLKLNLEVPADAMRDNLMRALDAVTGRSGWLGTRPSVWQSGNVAVSHAGGCPLTPLSAQSDQDLRWGHPSFPANQRKDGLWMVHGHYITDRPKVNGRHIGIDTGAYMTGKLTAARVSHGEVEFIST